MTKILKIQDITLEGPDLSGKTRLYCDLHKLTSFKWNIQDRSEISMAIYSEMYKRPDSHLWWEKINEKLGNLNHRYVLLIPDQQLLLERYSRRGDEIQDEKSLIDLHQRFAEAASKLSKFPTCIIVNVTRENQSDVKHIVLNELNKIEQSSTLDITNQICNISSASRNREVNGLCFTLDLTNWSNHDPSVLEYEKERQYYKRISEKYIKTIHDEIEGNNEYKLAQSPHLTRRFVYTDPSCISYINTHIRDEKITMNVVCRSSDVKNTLYYDVSFLQILFDNIQKIFLKTCDISRVIMKVRLDSAHIIGEVK